jgi:chromosome partitioning protein
VGASPAGEPSGHVTFSGSRQDGETATVDQSREWPNRDTAPRQDPAVSRPDPIWGDDAPNSVRWHRGMATGEGDPHQPEQPGAAAPPAAEPAAAGSGWFSVDPSPDQLARSADDRRATEPTGSGQAATDAATDWRTAAPGPDLSNAGMVHIDPEPGIDPPAGSGQPKVPGGEPVPWTEPAPPMPWPPPVEAPAGGGAVAAEGEQEQPPAPDPRWPRLFAVGLGTDTVRLEQGGDHRPQQRAADHGTPVAGPESSGDQPGGSATPPWHPRQPDGGGEDAGTVAATVPTITPPEVQAGPVTEPVAAEHDGPGQGDPERDGPEQGGPGQGRLDHGRPGRSGSGEAGAGSPRGRGAGAASTEAAAGGQAVDVPDPGIVGPAKTEQMVSRPPTSASGAPSRGHANMAPADLSSPSVSPETEGGGGVVKQRPDDPSIEEDEAAIAVREAVSRAAAQAGVDVSRETSTDGHVEPAATTAPGALVEALGDIPRIDSEAAAKNARVTFRIHTDGANGHGRILAVANQKGGVGKSTTAVNLGAYLALAGARILVVDLDPQGNASTGLGLDHRDIAPSIYDVLTGETPPATAIRATTVANLHVLPSTIDLAGAEVELVSAMSREGRLRRALDSIHQYYDTVLVDCPPSLGLLTVNALAAADELLIPIQCEYYALEGLGQLLRNIELVRANLNPELRIGGIVLTMYDGRTRLAEQVVGEVRKHFSDLVYQTVVPRSVRLSEAPGYGLPIALYDPLSRGGIAYRDLAFELAERSGLLAPTGEGAI